MAEIKIMDGGMLDSEWEVAVCASGVLFGRVRTYVVGAMFCYMRRLYI